MLYTWFSPQNGFAEVSRLFKSSFSFEFYTKKKKSFHERQPQNTRDKYLIEKLHLVIGTTFATKSRFRSLENKLKL